MLYTKKILFIIKLEINNLTGKKKIVSIKKSLFFEN